MFVSYWLEPRSRWFVLVFAAASALTAVYSALVDAYPITVIEVLWAAVALRRFVVRSRTSPAPDRLTRPSILSLDGRGERLGCPISHPEDLGRCRLVRP